MSPWWWAAVAGGLAAFVGAALSRRMVVTMLIRLSPKPRRMSDLHRGANFVSTYPVYTQHGAV